MRESSGSSGTSQSFLSDVRRDDGRFSLERIRAFGPLLESPLISLDLKIELRLRLPPAIPQRFHPIPRQDGRQAGLQYFIVFTDGGGHIDASGLISIELVKQFGLARFVFRQGFANEFPVRCR